MNACLKTASMFCSGEKPIGLKEIQQNDKSTQVFVWLCVGIITMTLLHNQVGNFASGTNKMLLRNKICLFVTHVLI